MTIRDAVTSPHRPWAALVIAAGVATACGGPPAPPRPPAAGDSFRAEIPDPRELAELDDREVAEQLRDWGVVATLARSGLSAAQTAAAMYQMPPVRLPYLDELFALEHGPGRRAYVDDRVLLFVDAGDRDADATLGRLADRVRMETGEIPSHFEIYTVRGDVEAHTITVRRGADEPGERLFSPAFGYVEATVGDAPALAAWLARVDGVSHAAISDGELRLGGRRFPRSRTQNVTLEDVAALYQAHRALADQGDPRGPGFSLDPRWVPDPADPSHPRMTALLRDLAGDPCAALSRLRSEGRRRLDALSASARDSGQRPKWAWAVEELDETVPQLDDASCRWLRDQLTPALTQLMAMMNAAPVEDWSGGYAPYWHLRTQLTRGVAALAARAGLSYLEAEGTLQCARYEGPLRGTAVGMNLFYTDLIAKLWAGLDYGRAAPVAAIHGMPTMPRTPAFATYEDESRALASTRLWFGARADGASRWSDGATTHYAFAPQYARVYAAGSALDDPGREGKPEENIRRVLAWWDQHYLDIAAHEPQFHALDEHMKWSAITGALAARAGAFDAMLATVPVARDLDFFRWHDAHRATLRNQIPLRPRLDSPTGTECLDALRSYSFRSGDGIASMEGGVSLVGRRQLEAIPALDRTRPRATRYQPSDEGGPGTAERARRVLRDTTVTVENAAAARTRTGAVDLNLAGDPNRSPPALRFRGDAGDAVIEVSAGALPVGELRVESREVVAIRWVPAAIDRAARVLCHCDPIDLAVVAGRLHRSPIRFADDNHVVVETAEGDFLEASAASQRDAATLFAAAARTASGVAWCQGRVLSAAEVAARRDRYRWQLLVPKLPGPLGDSVAAAVERVLTNQEPPAHAQRATVTMSGTALEIRRRGNTVFVRRPAQGWTRVEPVLARMTPAQVRELSRSGRAAGGDPAGDRTHLLAAGDLAASRGMWAEASQLHREAGSPGDGADANVRAAVAALAARQPARCKAIIDELRARGEHPSAGVVEMLRSGLAQRGQDDAAALIAAQLGGRGLPRAIADASTLEVRRGSLIARYRLPKGIPSKAVDTAEGVKMIRGGVPTYIEDRLLAGREGFELDPGSLVAEVAATRPISMRILRSNEGMIPGLLDVGARRYERIGGPGGEGGGYDPQLRPWRLLVTSCADDGDGNDCDHEKQP